MADFPRWRKWNAGGPRLFNCQILPVAPIEEKAVLGFPNHVRIDSMKISHYIDEGFQGLIAGFLKRESIEKKGVALALGRGRLFDSHGMGR